MRLHGIAVVGQEALVGLGGLLRLCRAGRAARVGSARDEGRAPARALVVFRRVHVGEALEAEGVGHGEAQAVGLEPHLGEQVAGLDVSALARFAARLVRPAAQPRQHGFGQGLQGGLGPGAVGDDLDVVRPVGQKERVLRQVAVLGEPALRRAGPALAAEHGKGGVLGLHAVDVHVDSCGTGLIAAAGHAREARGQIQFGLAVDLVRQGGRGEGLGPGQGLQAGRLFGQKSGQGGGLGACGGVGVRCGFKGGIG